MALVGEILRAAVPHFFEKVEGVAFTPRTMKSLITTMLAIGVLVPASSVYAMSVDEMIDNAKAGNGISVESHASASTGGQTAAAGQSVLTGDSSASSNIETHIKDGNAGGSVHVKVETTQNGTTTTEEYSKDLAPGEGVHVEVGTSSARGTASSTAGTSTVPHASSTIAVHTKTFFSLKKLPDFFRRIFAFIWRF